MGPLPPLNVVDRASVSLVRERVREIAHEVGLGVEDTERMALAASELAQNQLDHARGGRIGIGPVRRDGVPGLQIEAIDEGPGIPDPSGSLAGSAPGRGLGAGLPSVRRMAEELDVHVRVGEGTTIAARRFAGGFRRVPEIGVFGRGVEVPSGDVAVVRRSAEGVLLAVIDGAGHGALAQQAASLAASVTADGRPPADLLEVMHETLRGTRGAAATLASIDRDRNVSLLGIGNVGAAVVGPAGVQRFVPQAGILGRGPRRVITERRMTLPPQSSLILFSDGVSSTAELGGFVGRSPIHIAQKLLVTHGKAHDDALVLVAR